MKMNISPETTPDYPWPKKKDFIKAVEAYIQYKEHKSQQLFEKTLGEILYSPFKDASIPDHLEEIPITSAELNQFNMQFYEFMVCLGAISKCFSNTIEVVLHQPVNQDPNKSIPSITLQLLK